MTEKLLGLHGRNVALRLWLGFRLVLILRRVLRRLPFQHVLVAQNRGVPLLDDGLEWCRVVGHYGERLNHLAHGIIGGIRLGTAAMTTKGFKEKEFEQVGRWIAEVLKNKDDEELKARINQENVQATIDVFKEKKNVILDLHF